MTFIISVFKVAAEQHNLRNLMKEPLTPFIDKSSGQPFMLSQMFDTTSLGYVYDRLLRPEPSMLRVLPTWVLFRNIDVVRDLIDQNGRIKSFSLHVFVRPASDLSSLTPPSSADLFPESQYYAGWIGAFGGKGPRCRNCAETKPVTVKKDISSKILALGLTSRHQARVDVIAEDEFGQLCPLNELTSTYGPRCNIDPPTIVGPIFESESPPLTKGDAAPASDDEKAHIMALQVIFSF